MSAKKFTDEELLEQLKPRLMIPKIQQVARILGVDVQPVLMRARKLAKEGKIVKIGRYYYLKQEHKNYNEFYFRRNGTS